MVVTLFRLSSVAYAQGNEGLTAGPDGLRVAGASPTAEAAAADQWMVRMSRRKVAIASVAAVVAIAAVAVAGWQAGWPPALFGSPGPSQQLGPHIQSGQIGSRSATPYRVGSNEYVSNLAAWKSLPPASRAALVGQLHVAERRFEALGRGVFPSAGSLTVQDALSHGTAGLTARGGIVLTSARSSTAASANFVSEDFGATAFGDRPFDYGRAVYAGATGLWSWTPCATGASKLPSTPEVTICGGQAFGVTSHLSGGGMTTAGVTVNGNGAALAAQPVIATFTNRTGHAAKITVSATAASVTVSLRTDPVSAACSPDSLLYSSPPPASTASGPPGRLLINLTDCVGTLDALAPIGKALKIISTLRNWATFAGDAYNSITTAQQLKSSPALQACAAGRMLSDIAAVLAPIGVPTCTPTPLPTWTGTVPAGHTVRFVTTPIVEEHFTGTGSGSAMIFSFLHLHITECPAKGSCQPAAPVPTDPNYWANRTYVAACPGIAPQPFSAVMHAGAGHGAPQNGFTQGFDVGVGGPRGFAVGDLTGDGQPEVAVVVGCHPTGTSPGYATNEVQIFTGSANGPKMLARLTPPYPDSPYPPVFGGYNPVFKISGGVLITSVEAWAPGDCHACASTFRNVSWHWNGQRFVPSIS
jgi:hypothetical protein